VSGVDHLFDGRVVTAWVLVAETIDEHGDRRLDCLHADASGDPLPWWTTQGLISAALETYQAVSPIATHEDEDDDDV
jgi:hypothetical protein